MPRRARVLIPGAFYHVYSRGNRRQPTYLDDEDRRVFLDRLLRMCAHTGAVLVAYCLMSNHFHLLIRPGPNGLPDLMHRVLCSYAIWFNRRHAAVGHLFQGRYGSKPVQSTEVLLIVLRYIHLNPVAAGMVRVPEHWPWSSHVLHLRARPATELAEGIQVVRRALGSARSSATKRYRDLMSLPAPAKEEVFDRVESSAAIALDIVPDTAVGSPGLDVVARSVAAEHGVSMDDLLGRSRKREFVEARRALADRAVRGLGYSLTELAAWLNRTPQSIHKLLARLDARGDRWDSRAIRRIG
jgi:REP element-mobilizing transposase RayT